jgi:WD40 repeat protein
VLQSFGLGQLQAAEASVIEEHVSHCEACARTVAQVSSDTFIERLRVAREPAPDSQATLPPVAERPAPLPESAGTSADAPDSTALPPELLQHPRYRVLTLLGAGGMGAVYKAEHRLMERVVALKVVAQAVVSNEAYVERFRREVKAAALLSHPNIVAAHDAEQAGDVHFLVMEYVEGTDLARWVADRGPLPVAEACAYARQCAAGLQHAHEHGMIHRDIKPHNLMRTRDGTVKILDFGLARLAAEAGSAPGNVTAQGTILGTVDYLAPEQADDARQADIRSDIYSLGCTLYHLLSGRPPFPKGTLVQKVMAHQERQPQSLLELRPDVPPDLLRVIERMMAKLPERRYQTPAEVCSALEPFAGGTAILDLGRLSRKPARSRPPVQGNEATLEAQPAKPSRRGRWPIAVAGLLLVLGGLAAAVAVYRIQTDNGELVISSEDPDVEVVIKQNGKLVQIIDTKTNKEVTLHSGLYELELKGNPMELKLSLDRVTIRRGETVLATVERRPSGDTAGGERPLPPAEIGRDAFIGADNAPAHVYCVTFSGDGRYFLAAGDASSRSPVRIYDGKTGKLVSQFIPDEDCGWSGAAFNPDGTQVVSWGNSSAAAYVWESATGKRLLRLEGHKEAVSNAAFSPDGKRLVSASHDRTLRVWDAATGKQLLVLEGHTDDCGGCFSPDGKWIVSASADNTIRCWDAVTGKEAWKQTEQGLGDFWPRLGFFSPDGTRLLSKWGDSVRVSELVTGKAVVNLTGPTEVLGASFLPNGRALVTWGKDKILRVWDLASGKEVRSLELGEDVDGNPDHVAISPNGRWVLTAHKDQTVRVRDLATGREFHRFAEVPRTGARSLAFSPDSRFAAAGSFRGWVYLWRLPAPPDEKVGEVRRFEGHTGAVRAAVFSADGKFVLSCSGPPLTDRTVRLWGAATGKELKRFEGHSLQVDAVALSPDGRLAASSSADQTVRLWDVSSGKEVRRLEGEPGWVVALAFSADGKQLLTGGHDATMRLWETATGKETRRFEGHEGPIQSVAFAPDGKTLASASWDQTVRLWEAASGKQLCKLEGHTDVVHGVAFSPDGKRVLSGGLDRVLRLWDAASGKELRTFEGHTDRINGVAYSPDGRRALSASADRTVRLWDVETGKELCLIPGHSDVVWSVAFSPDGCYAVSASADGSACLWRLPKPAAAPLPRAQRQNP